MECNIPELPEVSRGVYKETIENDHNMGRKIAPLCLSADTGEMVSNLLVFREDGMLL